ncbi:MAG: hypothetical protein RLZZ217_1079 [Planctomycetota bacterium]
MSISALNITELGDGFVSLSLQINPEKPRGGVVVLDAWLIDQIHIAMDRVESMRDLSGFILESASERVFVAGADLAEIDAMDDTALHGYLKRAADAFCARWRAGDRDALRWPDRGRARRRLEALSRGVARGRAGDLPGLGRHSMPAGAHRSVDRDQGHRNGRDLPEQRPALLSLQCGGPFCRGRPRHSHGLAGQADQAASHPMPAW